MKRDFEQRTVRELRDAIERDAFSGLPALLDWLRRDVAAMTPGSDPLPALRAPIARLVGEWETDLGSPLLEELRGWAAE